MDEAEDFIVTDSSADTNLVAMKTEGLTASLGSLYSGMLTIFFRALSFMLLSHFHV